MELDLDLGVPGQCYCGKLFSLKSFERCTGLALDGGFVFARVFGVCSWLAFVSKVGFRRLFDFAGLRVLGWVTFGLMLALPFFAQSLSSQTAFDGEGKERNLCKALETRLSDPDRYIPLERDFVKGCTDSEIVVIFSDTWPQFVSNHIEYVDRDGIPVNFYRALRAKEQGEDFQAIYLSDIVFQKVIGVFLESGDAKRGGIYTSLIVKWRNEIISSLVEDPEGWVESLEESERDYLKRMGLERYFSVVSPEDIIICLLTSDPLIGEIRTIVESRKFTECLDE